jgi:hypothetical protein
VNNANGTYAIKKGTTLSYAEVMANYDNLPPNLRQVLQNAEFDIRISHKKARLFTPKTLRSMIKSLVKESAVNTYGKTYPIDII